MSTLYIFVGSLVAFAYGIRLTWLAKDDGVDDFDAVRLGGAAGLLLGAIWPATLVGHLIGWLGLKARQKWLDEQESSDANS